MVANVKTVLNTLISFIYQLSNDNGKELPLDTATVFIYTGKCDFALLSHVFIYATLAEVIVFCFFLAVFLFFFSCHILMQLLGF